MPTYKVTISHDILGAMFINATSPQSAKDIAEQEYKLTCTFDSIDFDDIIALDAIEIEKEEVEDE